MLLLVRHGQSEANAAGLLLGRADSPLTALGRRQADARRRRRWRARPVLPCRLLTSPLRRARETAEAIAAAIGEVPGGGGRPEIEVDERFVELDYGELDGTAPGDLEPGVWDRWRSEAELATARRRDPRARSATRVAAACEELAVGGVEPRRRRREPCLADQGGGHLGSCEPAQNSLGDLSLSVASITRIATYGPSGPALVSFNETTHLSGLGAASRQPC